MKPKVIVFCLVVAAIIAWAIILCSCSMTVAPKPAHASQVAFSGNHQDAGVINCDSRGCIVRPSWIAKYKSMETEFKDANFPADATDIHQEGNFYRVSYEVSNHYAEMREAERNP